ncbi:MAG: diaminopimelate decarboxylase [Actinomycetaceae bacterium]|nr:diaminopimelate decarboxylase [Actinomycetaceae bacterium]
MNNRLDTLSAPEPDGASTGIWPASVRREDGELSIGGISVHELVEEFGSPLYVLDEDELRGRCRAWKQAMDEAFADLAGAQVYYAGKAFLSVAVARAVSEEGLGVDTCSQVELMTALAAGVPGSKLGLHGNNKSREEIELALDAGLAHVVVDSLSELALVDAIAAERGQVADVMLRVTTGVHAGGHEYISTAHEDQKFGLSIAGGAARRAIEEASEAANVRLVGLHSHIGSQIQAVRGFEVAAEALLDLRATAIKELGIALDEVDFGGGYATRYTVLDDVPPPPSQFAHALAAVVEANVAQTGIAPPHVSIEPGRCIAAPAGVTLYTVGTIKTVQADDGPRRYVSVDGGMSDNIRPALYGADYTAALASRQPSEGVRSRVVGKHCESGDIVVRDVSLSANLARGDILAVPATGAYGRAMASNYNLLPRPGVVAVRGGKARWIVRREAPADLLALDVDYEA